MTHQKRRRLALSPVRIYDIVAPTWFKAKEAAQVHLANEGLYLSELAIAAMLEPVQEERAALWPASEPRSPTLTRNIWRASSAFRAWPAARAPVRLSARPRRMGLSSWPRGAIRTNRVGQVGHAIVMGRSGCKSHR